MKRTMKKLVSAALAATCIVGSAATFSACTTNHPEVEMQISFNGTTYTLEYKLYRKIAPNTVNHFLALVENGYYNEKNDQNICIHDYNDDKWYGGVYEFNANTEEDGGLVYRDYFNIVSAYENKDFVSVWKDSAKTLPTYTLYGEFSENGMTLSKGDFLSQSLGSLSMCYTSKGENADEYEVFAERFDGNGMRSVKYEKNSATSMFAINITGTGINKNYATFATLMEDSEEEFNRLKTAVENYIKNNFSDDEDATFTQEVEIHYGQGDPFIEDAELTAVYDVPSKPIIIKSVKVLKY